jgi:hypothetical protein
MPRSICFASFALLLATLAQGAPAPVRGAATDPVFGDALIHRFDLENLRDVAAESGEKALVTLSDDLQFTGAPALKWVTESTDAVIRLKGEVSWAKAKFLSLDVYYDSDHAGMLQLRCFAKDEKSPRLTSSLSLTSASRAKKRSKWTPTT